ncbi:MAG: hypothetical protein ACXW4T_08990, partial [Candidatus Limnocylindrales bacterium]
MRHRLAALLFVLTALVGSFVSAPSAQAVEPPAVPTKVVIIVGATEGTTAKYIGYANEAYAEAIKYTSNV